MEPAEPRRIELLVAGIAFASASPSRREHVAEAKAAVTAA